MERRVGRTVISEAARRGVDALRTECEGAMQHARRRAERMQQPQSSSLAMAATEIQERDDEKRVQREAKDALRASRSKSFAAQAHGDLRNERMELVEPLERGPRTYIAPADDPTLAQYEPNSHTRLRTRLVADAQLQAYLDSRYVITPSMLYSLTKRTGTSQSHSGGSMDGDVEVPLYGDWVLFAVMGEKTALKYTAATVEEEDAGTTHDRSLAPFQRSHPSRPARKYFGCKLLDLSTEVVEAHRHLPGHCQLSMMLFEAKTQGGGGAFEKLWKERDGMLLAILNPRIMQPKRKVRRMANQNATNELTITPRSADSILVLGQAEAYTQCQSLKKDGQRCKAFVMRNKDNTVCDYHLEQAVAGRLRSRMEFASGYAPPLTQDLECARAADRPHRPWCAWEQPAYAAEHHGRDQWAGCGQWGDVCHQRDERVPRGLGSSVARLRCGSPVWTWPHRA